MGLSDLKLSKCSATQSCKLVDPMAETEAATEREGIAVRMSAPELQLLQPPEPKRYLPFSDGSRGCIGQVCAIPEHIFENYG